MSSRYISDFALIGLGWDLSTISNTPPTCIQDELHWMNASLGSLLALIGPSLYNVPH